MSIPRITNCWCFVLVSISLLQSQRRFCSSWDWDNCTMVCSWNWTRQPGTWLRLLSHILLTVIHQERTFLSSFTREATVKSTDKEFRSRTIASLPASSANTASIALRTLFTRLWPVDQSSRRRTISCGHSSFRHHSAASKSRDTPSVRDTVPMEIERNS